jgi:uncharacterized protein YndB with AHSA1/START domain
VGTTISAPPEVVWRVLEPLERHVEWMADARAIRFRGPRRTGVGTELECVTRVGPFRTTDRMVVTEWEPPRTLGIAHEGAVRGRGRFTLSRRRNGRTRFTWTEHLHFPWWAGGPLGALAARPVLRRIWKRNLARLARLVEEGS